MILSLLILGWKLCLNQARTSMRVPDLAVRRVCFEHDPLNRDVMESLKVLLRFEAAPVDAHIQIQINDLVNLLFSSSKRVNDACCESLPIFSYYIIKISPCVSVMKIHRQFIFFGQIEMVRENLQLLLFGCIVKSVVVQATLSDRHQLILNVQQLLLQGLEIRLDRFMLSFIEGLIGSARVNTNSQAGVLVLPTKLMGVNGVCYATRCDQEMAAAYVSGPFNNLLSIVFVVLLLVINSSELVIRQVRCDIVESVSDRFYLHESVFSLIYQSQHMNSIILINQFKQGVDNQNLSSWGLVLLQRVNLVPKQPFKCSTFLMFSKSLASTVFWAVLASALHFSSDFLDSSTFLSLASEAFFSSFLVKDF